MTRTIALTLVFLAAVTQVSIATANGPAQFGLSSAKGASIVPRVSHASHRVQVTPQPIINPNPFGGGQHNPFSTPAAVDVAGQWTSNYGPTTVSQRGSDFVFTLTGSQFSGRISGHSVRVTHMASGHSYNGTLSLNHDTMSFRNVTLTRQSSGPSPFPTPPPVPQMRQVRLDSLRCTDLQNDRIVDPYHRDNVRLMVYADGQLVDVIDRQFTGAEEGMSKRLSGRTYSYRQSLSVKLQVGGNPVTGKLLLTTNSRRGAKSTSFSDGISRRFEWTQYDLFATVL